jgi:hypothetical protein
MEGWSCARAGQALRVRAPPSGAAIAQRRSKRSLPPRMGHRETSNPAQDLMGYYFCYRMEGLSMLNNNECLILGGEGGGGGRG